MQGPCSLAFLLKLNGGLRKTPSHRISWLPCCSVPRIQARDRSRLNSPVELLIATRNDGRNFDAFLLLHMRKTAPVDGLESPRSKPTCEVWSKSVGPFKGTKGPMSRGNLTMSHVTSLLFNPNFSQGVVRRNPTNYCPYMLHARAVWIPDSTLRLSASRLMTHKLALFVSHVPSHAKPEADPCQRGT